MSIRPPAAPSSTTATTTAPPSSSPWSNTGPRYNNNDVFDGHYLLRRHNRSNNQTNYIEGDSYRAQHIPALMEGNGGTPPAKTNSSSTWSSNPPYSQQHQQRWLLLQN